MAFWDFLTRLLQPVTPGVSATADASDPAAVAAVEAVVLLTALEDDPGAVGDTVFEALCGLKGVTIRRSGSGCGSVEEDEVLPVSLSSAARRARALGLSSGAQAVVFGEVRRGGVRLRFIPTVIDGDSGSGSLLPGDLIDLPMPLADSADLIPACALAALACPSDAARRVRMERLRGFLPVVDRLCQGLNGGADGQRAASVSLCYAAMLTEIGFRTDQRTLLDRATDITRAALAKGKNSLGSAQVAAARVRYGDITLKIGIDDANAEMLEEAGRHFRTASEVFTAETFPEEYALLKAQAGRTMHRLGVQSGKSAVMKEAVQSYFEATKVWTKGGRPDRWAEMQQAMGAVMTHLGEASGNAEILNRACKVFEGATEVWSREKNPRRWASLMNNIGACRFAQGKRSGDLPVLREASECFAKALEVYSALGMSRNVFVTQKNLARVDRLISVQEGRV